MTHHLLKEIDQKNICIYCGLNLAKEDWKSEFHLKKHYHTISCKCGKKIRRKVNFIGSGHKHKKKKSIDSVIREVRGKIDIKDI